MTDNKWFMHTDSHSFTGLGSPFTLQRALEEHFPEQRTQRVRMPEPTALRACTSSVPSTLRAMHGWRTWCCGNTPVVAATPHCSRVWPS